MCGFVTFNGSSFASEAHRIFCLLPFVSLLCSLPDKHWGFGWPTMLVSNAPMNTSQCLSLCGDTSEEAEPGPSPGVPDLVELEPAEEGADDEVTLDLLFLVAALHHAVLEEAEVGDDPPGEVGVEHGALAEDLEVHREVEAAAQQDDVL